MDDPERQRLVSALAAAWRALRDYDARAAARRLWQARHLCLRCRASVAPWDAYCPGCATPNYRAWKRVSDRLEPQDPPRHRRPKP